jgi:ABC-2 type transport system permease protein
MPMILFAVMCAPAAIIVAVAIGTKMTKMPIEYTRYVIIMQAVISLFLAAQAPQSVSLDLRFKVTPLYFSRPIERIDYVAAKYTALATALFILTAVPVTILYIGALLAKFDFTDATSGFAKALVAELLLSLLYAGLGLLIAALTPRRGFGVAGIIALFTLSYGAVTSVQAVASVQGSKSAIGWLGLFSPITLIDGVQTWWLGAGSSYVDGAGPSSALAGCVFLLVLLALIGGTFGLLMSRYRKVGLS